MRIGRSLGGRPILVATDEEAAVLIAEQAARLGEQFVLPVIAPGLPRELATKYTLHSLCVEHGIPTPASAQPRSPDEVLEFAGELGLSGRRQEQRALAAAHPAGGPEHCDCR